MVRPNSFQSWLQDELDARDWTQAKLAREINVYKGSVGRWLAPVDSQMYRSPTYENCKKLAAVFGVDRKVVLELVGMDDFKDEENLTELQRDIISIVIMLPDDMLTPMYPQLRNLLDENVQQSIRAGLGLQPEAHGGGGL